MSRRDRREAGRKYHQAQKGCPRYRLHRLVAQTKHRARMRGIEFGLDWRLMEVPSVCPLLGIPLEFGGGYKGRINSPSLDRIDPRKGYTTDNVWFISNRANTIKNDATLAELEMITENLRAKVLGDNGKPKRT